MKLAGDILILIFLIITNGRVFSLKKSRTDSLVMLAPLSFLLSSLMLFAFSVDIFSILIWLLSLLVLLTNFHALFRISSKLVIDRYSGLMKGWAVFTLAFSSAILLGLIFFRPVYVSSSKLGVTETKKNFSGSFASDFSETETFTICNAYFTEFSTCPEITYRSNVVIFMPDKRGDTEAYKPFLQKLSKAGFTVCTCDFYTKDGKWIHSIEDSRMLRSFGLRLRSLVNRQDYLSRREYFTFNFSKELEALLKILKTRYGEDCRYFIATDNLGITAANDIAQKYSDLITGTFDISTVPEYKTAGYGFVEQTDPLTALLLGQKRDKNFTAVNACVEKTSESIKDSLKIKRN